MDISQTVRTAVQGLIDRSISVDQAAAVAQQNLALASYLVAEYLQQFTYQPGRAPAQTVLELQWRLKGATHCIQYEFIGLEPRGAYDQFIVQKLIEEPDLFSDSDLVVLGQQYTSSSVNEVARRVQLQRVGHIANALLENPRELSADVAEVKRRVAAYAFNPELNALLEKVELGLSQSGDGMDQAALLKHLRTFFEKLHDHIARRLQLAKPETVDGTDLSKCGQAIDYLLRKGVLTEKMRDYARALYGVLSNEGVHSATSKREYVRLFRNTVAEYALVLFFELESRLA